MYSAETSTVAGINATIGRTPLVRLEKLSTRADIRIWAKLEEFNPGRSTKDRTASALVNAGIADGTLNDGVSVIESSSGNLGMALARECLLHGWPFHCVVDPRANPRALAIMKAFGAIVHMVECPDPATGDWLIARRALVKQLLAEIPKSLSLDQYSNRAAFDAHADGTMSEILEDLGSAPDLLLVAMSTTGTIGGCLQKLHNCAAKTHVIGVDAQGSVLFGGTRSTRTLPGFGAGVVPELAHYVHPDEVMRVCDIDAVAGARLLVQKEGILAGASGGAVIAALLAKIPELPTGAEIVIILHDSGAAYVDTIFDDTWVLENLHTSAADLAKKMEQL
ncbi:pyridoxal-phosphate dependent enzyme [Corynebacterium callunae]|uniref:pyridoxal-phosphate dependent enzyme n=1 Tax=Corynebacterium callunae TaxID=1721 RepID=UPI00398220F8